MKSKPFSIKLIALGYVLAPIVNVIIISWLNHWPFLGARSVFLHFSPYDWFVLTCFPVVGLGIFLVSRIGNIGFIIFSIFLIGHNTYNYIHNPIYSIYLVLLFNMAMLGIVGFFLQKHIWQAYYNPGFRWWEHPMRYRTSLKATVHVRQINVEVNLVDISQGGCFLEAQSYFQLGEKFEIVLSREGFKATVWAQVVWSKDSKPMGFGIMFINLNKFQKRQIKLLIDLFKASPQSEMPRSNFKAA